MQSSDHVQNDFPTDPGIWKILENEHGQLKVKKLQPLQAKVYAIILQPL